MTKWKNLSEKSRREKNCNSIIILIILRTMGICNVKAKVTSNVLLVATDLPRKDLKIPK
jgi:hypothetical protein